MTTPLLKGAVSSALPADIAEFNASVAFDQNLALFDIEASTAHAVMLAAVGILTADEADKITEGLAAIRAEIVAGTFAWQTALEDVHMNIEAALIAEIGAVGGKLHTARSRNDQVATDLRLYVRAKIDALADEVQALQAVLLDKAEATADAIFPGFTHLQVAQPVTFGHHMMAWFEMLARDRARLADARHRVNQMPLGSAALAGTPYPIDRTITQAALQFEGVCLNSLDAVSDRDFAIEAVGHCALLMVHLSRMCEEIIVWNSQAFGFVALSEAYATTSSIMPQKQNPDIAELIRGKSARVVAAHNALLMLMKSQPLAYNKDNQEDKEPVFDAFVTTIACVKMMAGMVEALTIKPEPMRLAVAASFANATDLADYLVGKGATFRMAHEMVGYIVRYASEKGAVLEELTIADMQAAIPSADNLLHKPDADLEHLHAIAKRIEDDVYAAMDIQASVAARNHIGGTAPRQVRVRIAAARKTLSASPI